MPTKAPKPSLEERLEAYRVANKVTSKGKLAAILFCSRVAKDQGLPLDGAALVTDGKGQVLGLGKAAVQKILAEHGVKRVLAEEAGRTSRGSLGHVQNYAALLNELQDEGIADLDAIEAWWVARVNDYFTAQPFKLRYDTGKSLRAMVRDLLEQAIKRQKENPGTTYAGAVMQHLVGAKLTLVLPEGAVTHNGYSVADAVSDRSGDFVLHDVAIHVTTAPGEALMRKCERNIAAGMRPIIVTTHAGLPGAESLAGIQGIAGGVDLWEVEQFIATNLYELSRFTTADRLVTVGRLVETYNDIVEECETDPSLKINTA
jgi:hypothetical protein